MVGMLLFNTLLGKVGIVAAVTVGIYAVVLGVLLTPSVQRFALYANHFNTLFLGDDLNTGEAYGFSKHQVTPFNLSTLDGETLYAWHVLPIDVYTRNEKMILAEERSVGPVEDLTKTNAFRYLTQGDAKVVVTFHGNAGHIAQGWRPDTYRYLTTQPNTHVLTIDYRGFGHSTGSPTEAGLIADGVALVDWVLKVAQIPPDRILILGQSLGTAVSSAVVLHFADPQNRLIPKEVRKLRPRNTEDSVFKPTVFAGVVLIAPFSSLPSLLLTYRLGGFLPILLPLRPFPNFASILTSQMVDKWPSAERLEAYYQSVSSQSRLLIGSDRSERSLGSIQLVHSRRDSDISYHQTEFFCRQMFRRGSGPVVGQRDRDERTGDVIECIDGTHGPAMYEVKAKGKPKVRFEIIEHGGEYDQVL
ncbi:hypothetical protein M433DRAFT_131528 [Acidomyces richmondensis BFW]|nr:hypothetical protein M433DRAFT_131528 [Acidomyces richmondensis BFW]